MLKEIIIISFPRDDPIVDLAKKRLERKYGYNVQVVYYYELYPRYFRAKNPTATISTLRGMEKLIKEFPQYLFILYDTRRTTFDNIGLLLDLYRLKDVKLNIGFIIKMAWEGEDKYRIYRSFFCQGSFFKYL